MGIYLNPGADMLRRGRNSKIYIDKSGLIAKLNDVLNTEQEYVCVSRPRRFGKTMAANMICAYYDRTVDGAKEFEGLAIASDPSFEANRNRYNVLRVDMQRMLDYSDGTVAGMIEKLNLLVCREIASEYPDLDLFDPSDLRLCVNDAYVQKHLQFVIVIDEWDCVMRKLRHDSNAQSTYLDYLRGWLKDNEAIALCYMTGILPIKKYGEHSTLNMFYEYSMTEPKQMAPYMGFDEEEVRGLCDTWDMDFSECEAWYDGYRLAGVGSIYSPRSVVEAMTAHRFGAYWISTETYEALKVYIDLNIDGLHGKVVELMSGRHLPVSISGFENDMATFSSADDVLTLLVHLGYLAYDEDTCEVFVPNREIVGEYATSVRTGGWNEVARSIEDSEALLDALISGAEDDVALGVQRAHEDASSIITYHSEDSLACTLRLAFFSAIRRYKFIREAPAGKGYADFLLVPLASCSDAPGIVIELKYDDTPEAAIAQIREREYRHALDGLVKEDNVILCGIGYDKESKKHTCRIVIDGMAR